MLKSLLSVIMLGLAWLSLATAAFADTPTAPIAVLPSNPAIHYIGRWDIRDPAVARSNWGGAYLRVDFTGTSAAIKVGQPANLVVSIDGEWPRAINAAAGITPLTSGPLHTGNHRLLVGSADQNSEVFLQSLVFDAGATVTAPITAPIIEFVGDSITTGTGPDSLPTCNYAWDTAESLGCDHTQIAYGGRALTSGFGCLPDKTGLDVQYFREANFNHTDTTAWNMSAYTPAIVVINLGQNDQCGAEPVATLSASLTAFIQKLHTAFPSTVVVVLRPFSGAYAATEQDTVRQLMFSGDSNVLFVDTSTWLTVYDFRDGVHPNGNGNLKIAARLSPILRALLHE